MSNLPGTDRDILTQKAYATDDQLVVRQRTHDLYSVPKINFAEWVLDRIAWRGDELVLDVGAGPGSYFDLLADRIPSGALVAGDLSMGMSRKAAQHPKSGPVLNFDAQALPFESGIFDVVLANHMLYHVPDVELALGEMHRVLKPGGCLIAATNSQFNMPEFEQLIRRSYNFLGVANEVDHIRPVGEHFNLEDGTVKLAHHFFAVARYDLPGVFIFPSVQPALDYLDSTRALREPQLPRRVSWDDFMGVMSEQIQRLINHFGELVVNKLAGVLIGSDQGSFARDYISILTQEDTHSTREV